MAMVESILQTSSKCDMAAKRATPSPVMTSAQLQTGLDDYRVGRTSDTILIGGCNSDHNTDTVTDYRRHNLPTTRTNWLQDNCRTP
jgi:hypothetical protein